MGFETYMPQRMGGRRELGEPSATIGKTGNLNVNGAAAEKWLEAVEFVQLLFDPEGPRIGIKPVAKGTEHALKLRRPVRSRGRQISGKGFLEYCGIAVGKTVRLPARWDEQAGAVVVDVSTLRPRPKSGTENAPPRQSP